MKKKRAYIIIMKTVDTNLIFYIHAKHIQSNYSTFLIS